jgi:hypothetical protein
MAELRADQSQYYAMKSLFERVLGKASFRRVKDYAPLSVWRSESINLIKAISVSMAATVRVVDAEWYGEFDRLMQAGRTRISASTSIDELFAVMSATLGELAFLQLGLVPQGHYQVERIPLIAQNWKLDLFRTVQYVQTPEQRKAQVRNAAGRAKRAET